MTKLLRAGTAVPVPICEKSQISSPPQLLNRFRPRAEKRGRMAGLIMGLALVLGLAPLQPAMAQGGARRATARVSCVTTVDPVASQTVCGSTKTTPITFSGTGNSYQWTNDLPSIGLAASGTGNIPSFTAVNSGNGPVTANISVTPYKVGSAYVPNYYANTVTVINTANGAVTGSPITVGTYPRSVSASLDGSTVYIGNEGSNDISVIGTSTNQVTATIPLYYDPGYGSSPLSPKALAVSPDGATLYVISDDCSNGCNGILTVINTATQTITASVTVGYNAQGIAVSPDGSTVYVGSRDQHEIYVVNTSSNTVTTTIPITFIDPNYNIYVNVEINALAISPDGSKVYVSSGYCGNYYYYWNTFCGGAVSVINTATNSVSSSIYLGYYRAGRGLALNPTGSRLYVATQNNEVKVISTATNMITNDVSLQGDANGISVNSDGTEVYIALMNSNSVAVLNTASNSVTSNIGVGYGPMAMGNFITPPGCPGTPVSFSITVKEAPARPTVSAGGPTSFCDGSSVLLTSSAASNNQWNLNGAAIAGATSTSYTAANSGLYSVSTSNTNGCSMRSVATRVRSSAVPVANAVANQTVCGGLTTNQVLLTGTGNKFAWTNSNPAIGLAASGSDTIPAFTALNNGNGPISATVTVTPSAVSFAYVPNYSSSTVSVINTYNRAVVATINVGSNPRAVAVSGDGSKVYTANVSGYNVSVISTATNTVTSNIPLSYNGYQLSPKAIAVSPDGSKLYVTSDWCGNGCKGVVTVINAATGAIAASVLTGYDIQGLALSPEGDKIYVGSRSNRDVSVIDAATNTVSGTIALTYQPQNYPTTLSLSPNALAVSADGSKLFVSTNYCGYNCEGIIAVIDPASFAIGSVISTGYYTNPQTLVASPDGTRLYASMQNDNEIKVFSTVNNDLLAYVAVGNTPTGLSINEEGTLLYVTNQNSGSVSVINTASYTVAGTIPVGTTPIAYGNFLAPAGCTGSPVSFTFTVNEAPVKPVISASGSTTLCTGGSVTLTSSATANNQWYRNGAAISGSTATTYVAASTGSYSVLTTNPNGCTTRSSRTPVTVNIIPVVNTVGNQTVCGGINTAAVVFAGTGNKYSWTNNQPSIGLAASGSDTIPSFAAINSGNGPVTATITVTPSVVGLAYVPSHANNSVSVINTATGAAVGSPIPVGNNPRSVATSADGTTVYVANENSSSISVISTATNTVTATIPVTYNSPSYGSFNISPRSIALSADGTKLYIAANYCSWYGCGSSVIVINTASNAVSATVSLPQGLEAVAASPDGSTVYAAHSTNGNIYLIDANTNTPGGTISLTFTDPGYNISVTPQPVALAFSSDGDRLYVTSKYCGYSNVNGYVCAGNITVIGTTTNTVIRNVNTGNYSQPMGIVESPDGTVLYATLQNSNTLRVINTSTYATVADIGTGASPAGVSVSNDGSNVFVANQGSGNISVINTATNTVSSNFTVGTNPIALGNFATSAGCTGTPATFTITVNEAPPVPAVSASGPLTFCDGQSVTLTSSALANNQWYRNGSPISGATSRTYTANTSGLYTVTVSNANGCKTSSATSMVTVNFIPTVTAVSNKQICGGLQLPAINFGYTGNSISWINSDPTIGLAASGTGDIAAFTAVNSGGAPKVATITVTPSVSGVAYVPNKGNGNVSMINTGTGAVMGSPITVGNQPTAVATSADGSKVYVANEGSSSISVISTATNTVSATIALNYTFNNSNGLQSLQPRSMALSADGTKLYVTSNYCSYTYTPYYNYICTGVVLVVNTATQTITDAISINNNPQGIAVSPDGSKVFVAMFDYNQLAVIKTSDNTVTYTSVGSQPYGVVVSPDGGKVYVSNQNYWNSGISILNVATSSVSDINFGSGATPGALTLNADGSKLYVANQNAGSVYIINTTTNAINDIYGFSYPSGLSLTADGSKLYVTNQNSSSVSIINTSDNSSAGSINVGSSPRGFGNFITAPGCAGTPVTFTITVDEAPPVPTVTANGSTSICQGSSVTLTSSAATNNQWYKNDVLIPGATAQSYTASASGRYSVAASNANGCSTSSVGTFVRVSFVPTVDALTSQTICGGSASLPVSFTGTATYFSWTNNNTAIGLAASGTGDIASFTPPNPAAPVTATITVTPMVSGFAYIPSNNNSTVSVINVGTGAIVGSPITVGSQPTAATTSADGSKVYIANQGSNSVSVINTATNTVSATIQLSFTINGNQMSARPYAMALSPDGTRLYVTSNYCAGYPYYTCNGVVLTVNTITNTVTSTTTINNNPQGIAVSPDGSKLFVAMHDQNQLAVIKTSDNTVSYTNIGSQPYGVVVSPDGSTVYVSNQDYWNGSVSVVNVASNAVTNIQFGYYVSPGPLTLSADGSKLYVANQNAGSVSVINTANNTYSTISGFSYPSGLSLTDDGGKLYVVNQNTATVSVVNTATNAITGTTSIGNTPMGFNNFITPSGCAGSPVSFTITSKPGLTSPTVTASGATTFCTGGSVTLTSSATTDNQWYKNGVAIPGAVAQTYSASTTGLYAVGLDNASSCASPLSAVPVVVNFIPVVNPVASQLVCNGVSENPIAITGTGNYFTWTNDNPAIGIAASGSGDIPAFTTTNPTSPITATITVTPSVIGLAYVPNANSGTVSVINVGTGAVVGNPITVGSQPTAVAASVDGSKVYIANQGSSSVSVINTATNTVSATIALNYTFNNSNGQQSLQPRALALSPDGTRLYVTSSYCNGYPYYNCVGVVLVINTTSGSITGAISLSSYAQGVVVSPDGSKVFVTMINNNQLAVIKTSDNTVAYTSVGSQPYGVVVSPDGNKVYVSNQDYWSGSVSVVNLLTNAVSNINIGNYNSPGAMTLSANGSKLYVANLNGGTVSVINTATSAISTIYGFSAPSGVSLTSDGSKLYVTNQNSSSVSVINTSDNSDAGYITVGSSPRGYGNFITPSGCTGAPVSFTITSKPGLAAPTITASGATTFCTGGSVTLTSSATTDNQWYKNGVAIAGATAQTYTATTTGRYGAGLDNANSCASPVTAVSVVVNYIPVANAIADQLICNGNTSTVVTPAGTGNYFNWTNSDPSIGLAASGSGDIAAFTAVNSGSAPKVATVTVTPSVSGFAYVPNYGANSVSVINTATGAVVGNPITVGDQPKFVSVSADGSKAYVANLGSSNVSVINTATNTVSATIALNYTFNSNNGQQSLQPRGMTVSPDGTRLYVTSSYCTGYPYYSCNGAVLVINTTSNTITGAAIINYNPQGIAVSPDGSKLFVAMQDYNQLAVIKTSDNSVTYTYVGSQPYGVVVSPDGNKVYVSNQDYWNGGVSVVEPATNTVSEIGFDYSLVPGAMALSADGSLLYVANQNSGSVSVINTASNTISNTIPGFSYPAALSLTSDGSKLYVVNQNWDNVSIVNTATSAITATTAVGSAPMGFGNFITPSGCTGSPVTFTITVNPKPGATIAGTATVCPNAAAPEVTFTGSNGTAPYTFSYRVNNGAIRTVTSASGNTATVAAPTTTAGSFVYSLVSVQDASTGSCPQAQPGSATITVSMPSPAVLSTGGPTAFCAGGSVQLLSSLATGNQWYQDGNAISGATGNTYTATAAGTYTVIADNGGCTSPVSNSISVTVNLFSTWTGTVSSDWSDAANWCGILPTTTTDVVIPAGVPHMPVILTSGSAHDITLSAGTTLDVQGTINLYGNLVEAVPGSFDAQGATFNFDGTSVQTTPAFTAANVNMNGTGGLVLGGATTITNTLALTTGDIQLGAFNLTLGSNITISGGSSASHIVQNGTGMLKALAVNGSRLFPLGTTFGSYSPVTITNTAGRDWTVQLSDLLPAGNGTFNTARAIQKLWDITPSAAPGATDLSFEYNTADANILGASFSTGGSVVANHYNPGTGLWEVAGTSQQGAPGVNTVSVSGWTTFSPFAIGNTGGSLPITLLRFSGRREGSVNRLRWTTASEASNSGFEVERSSDGIRFASIGFVRSLAPNGNSSSNIDYRFDDAQPGAGRQYYRLKQVDFNGRYTRSAVVILQADKQPGFELTLVYPTPVHSRLNIVISSAAKRDLRILLTDATGKVVRSERFTAEAGTNSTGLDVSPVAAGSYILRVISEDGTEHATWKVVKQ